MVKIRTLYLIWSWIGTWSWRTDGRTDRITVPNTPDKSMNRDLVW